jgi:hypothetical protein
VRPPGPRSTQPCPSRESYHADEVVEQADLSELARGCWVKVCEVIT